MVQYSNKLYNYNQSLNLQNRQKRYCKKEYSLMRTYKICFKKYRCFNINKHHLNIQLILTPYQLSRILLDMTNCQIQLLSHVLQIIQNSAKYILHKGQYHECLEVSDLKYVTVQFGEYGIDIGAFMGLCLPRACSDDQIVDGINSVFLKSDSDYRVFSIDSQSDTFHVDSDWLTYLTLALLATLVLVTIYSTLTSKTHKIIKAFNAKSNMAHFKIRQKEDLNILDGIRAISMLWVVIGHVYSFILGFGVQNIMTIDNQIFKPFLLIIEAGIISVDVFFMLGGFFLAFVFLRQDKNNLSIYPLGIIQRALRIWPAYIIAMMFYYSVFMQLGSGPSWSKTYVDVQTCSTMWRSIFFIENLVDNGRVECLGWSWYLQVDFQLFLISLFLLFLYNWKKVVALIVTLFFMFASTVFCFQYTFRQKVKIFTDLSSFSTFADFMLNVYTKPWGRCTPYLMGLVFGVLYMDFKKNKSNANPTDFLGNIKKYLGSKPAMKTVIELVGLALMAFVTFIPRFLQIGYVWPQIWHSLYASFSKITFVFGVICTILPTVLGFNYSFLNLLLTAKIFHFIARISFCTYLVHLMVIYQFIYTRSADFYYNVTDIFVIYMGLLVVSLAFGFLMTLVIEIPCANLQKELLAYLKTYNRKPSLTSHQLISPSLKSTLITNQEQSSDIQINKNQQ